MSCKKYQERIALDLIDEVSSRESREAQDHTDHCPVCRAYLEALQENHLARFRGSDPGSPSPEIWMRIRHRILSSEIAAGESNRGGAWKIFARLGVVLPAAALVFVLSGRMEGPDVRTSLETELFIFRDAALSGDAQETEDLLNFGSAAEDFLF